MVPVKRSFSFVKGNVFRDVRNEHAHRRAVA
jgi:hypothetical protein